MLPKLNQYISILTLESSWVSTNIRIISAKFISILEQVFIAVLDLKSICNGSSKAEHLKWGFIGYGLDSKRAGVRYPEVSKTVCRLLCNNDKACSEPARVNGRMDTITEVYVPEPFCRNRSHDCLGNTPWVTYALTFAAPWVAKTFYKGNEGSEFLHWWFQIGFLNKKVGLFVGHCRHVPCRDYVYSMVNSNVQHVQKLMANVTMGEDAIYSIASIVFGFVSAITISNLKKRTNWHETRRKQSYFSWWLEEC